MLLIRHVSVFSPTPCGEMDLLLAGGRIEAMAPRLDLPANLPGLEILDGTGKIAVPGFIDNHVHILGAGGEGGFRTRTPELQLSELIKGGITTVVGCRGTDGFCRGMPDLLAKAKALREEGVTALILTGSYQVPVRTLTGSIEQDILWIQECIGVGEVAMSDHRSSQPETQDLARVAASARLAGMLSGKAGLVNLHLGDSPAMLRPLREILDRGEIPPSQFLPTHMGRNPELFQAGLEYAKTGGFLDFTTSSVPLFVEKYGEIQAADALAECLARGVPLERITFSSDGHGSLPAFDGSGRLVALQVGRVTSLFAEVRQAVRQRGVPLEHALAVITSNPARLLALPRKGQLQVGADADVVLLTPESLAIETVISAGKVLMQEGILHNRGTFEEG